MIEELDILRDKIDRIDQELLVLLAKRLALVTRVGEIKSQHGLFIYSPDREEVIVHQRRKEAVALGVSPDLIEDVIRRIMRESYCNENAKGFKTLHPNLRPIVIIGGKGRVGSFFSNMLVLSGYKVRILDKDDWAYASSMLVNAGMVLISVPISLVIDVINKLPNLPNDCIVVDLSSIKKITLEKILSIHNGPVLGLHLMFSPDYSNMVKQVVIYCDGRYPDSYRWLLDQIQLWGAIIYSCDPGEHDKHMQLIQGLCHFITFSFGYYIFQDNIDLKKILSFASPIFQLKMVLVGRLFSQDPQLYADIIMSSNNNNIILIKSYYRRLGQILTLLEQNNKQDFINQFKKIKDWMNVYADLFFKKSHKVLCQINDMKK